MGKLLHVLIVEDSEDDAQLLLFELRRSGYEPFFERVETHEAMKEALARRQWDLVVSDYIMPRFSGLHALKTLRESGLDLPFIIVSGNIGEDMAVEAMKAGAHDYIIKGKLARLAPAVERELREAEMRRERTRAEEELKHSHEQLRSLSQHLESVREKERAYIAREIHDELGQALTAMKMDLSWLANRYHDHTMLIDKAQSMLSLIDAMIQAVKRIAAELRPALLDHLGLAAAIEWLAKEFQNRTSIQCDLVIHPPDIILDRDRSTAIFRIFQETLTNVMRHAGATKVTASLEWRDGEIVLSVEDDGKGITDEQIADPGSFGLMGMRERVQFFGGRVTISGMRQKGTSVTVRIPLDTAEEEEFHRFGD